MVKLSELHEQPIDVEVELVGRKALLSGVGYYEQDATLGSILRIRFGEEAGGMDILLEEARWRGTVDRPAADKPYTLRLDSLAPSASTSDAAT